MCDRRNMRLTPICQKGKLRRQHSRLRLGIPARLETLYGRREVELLDLSQTGAKVALPRFEYVGTAVLHWLGFDAFGEIVWQDDGLLGMAFDEPLPPGLVLNTRNRAPSVVSAEDGLASDAAKAWASGTFNSGTER